MRILENDVHLMEQLRLFSLSLFSPSLSSTFISGSVHDILVLVACLKLQSLLSIYSCSRLYAFLIRSCVYIDIETPLDHALTVEVYVIVVHPFQNIYKEQEEKKQKRKKKLSSIKDKN